MGRGQAASAVAEPRRRSRLRQATPERILLRLDWQVIRRLDGLLQGDYRSLFYGYGVDFADLREYQPGDDIRYIDWNVTARMDTPYVRQYVEDRDITAWFLLDLSPSMDFGTVQTLKRTLLIDFVATVARLLTRHGNRVGAILYSGSTDTWRGASGAQASPTLASDACIPRISAGPWPARPPTAPATGPCRPHDPCPGGRIQVLRLVNDLLKYRCPGASEATKGRRQRPAGADRPLRALRRGAARCHGVGRSSLSSRTLPACPGGSGRSTCWRSATRCWPSASGTRASWSCPTSAPSSWRTRRRASSSIVDTHDRKFRQRFQEAALAREAALGETFRRAGIDALSLSTEDDLVRAIVRFATLRQQQRVAVNRVNRKVR